MGVEVRTIAPDELEAWGAAMFRGFHGQPQQGWADFYRPDYDLERVWAAFDGDQVVGTLRSFASELTVPGGALVPSAALTNVTVAPTHRRQGLLRRMLDPDLAAAKERGEPLAVLIAAEFPIYGRFGYGSAADHVLYAVDARTVQFVNPGTGTVELIDGAALRREAPALYERFRRHQPGTISRSERWWDARCQVVKPPGEKAFRGYLALHRNDSGQPEGYLRYRSNGHFDARRADATLTVEEMLAVTPGAYARLWRYCCEVDWVAHVEAQDRSSDEVLPWIVSDARHVVQKWRSDFLWVRPLDIPVALAARTYLAEGGVVLEVLDPHGFATGRYRLEGGPDGAVCKPTTETAGVTITAEALGAAYLGNVTLGTLARAGQVRVADESALATADAMFRGAVAPWCTTWF